MKTAVLFSSIILLNFISSVNALTYELDYFVIDSCSDRVYEPSSINNKGQVAGTWFAKRPIYGESTHGIFLHEPGQKIHILSKAYTSVAKINDHGTIAGTVDQHAYFIKGMDPETLTILATSYSYVHDINNRNEVVGYYSVGDQPWPLDSRGFIWDGEHLNDLGPGSSFAQEVESQYPEIAVLGTIVHAINDQGQLAGMIVYKQNRPHSEEPASIMRKLFFYDGIPHLIPFELPPGEVYYGNVLLDNKGDVIFSIWDCLYRTDSITKYYSVSWNRQTGLKKLGDFVVSAINGQGDCVCQTLDAKGVFIKGNFYSVEEFFGPAVKRIEHRITNINDNCQLTGYRNLWEEPYPFIATPK